MAFNIGNSISGALAGAGTGASFGGYGALIGAGVGALTGGFSGSGASSANMMSMQDMYNLEMYNTMKDLYMMNVQKDFNVNSMKLANQLTQSNMKYSSALQKDLNHDAYLYNIDYLQRQYNKNRKLAEDSYPIAVESMKRAGLNPILAAGNGTQASVGLPSASAGSVGGSSASSLGVNGPSGRSTNLGDIASALINTYKAKIDKAQLGLNTANTVADIKLKDSQSAKNLEEAKSQESVRQLNESSAFYNKLKSVEQNITNSNLDSRQKAEIKKIIAEIESIYGNLDIARFLAPYQARNLEQTGNSAVTTAGANVISAKAKEAEAQAGNVTKVLADLFKGTFGDYPGDFAGKIRQRVKKNMKNFSNYVDSLQ